WEDNPAPVLVPPSSRHRRTALVGSLKDEADRVSGAARQPAKRGADTLPRPGGGAGGGESRDRAAHESGDGSPGEFFPGIPFYPM
ncbi:MAG TPA: hypothetical protein VH349_12110, partial [Ktedonobacterales bacterium]